MSEERRSHITYHNILTKFSSGRLSCISQPLVFGAQFSRLKHQNQYLHTEYKQGPQISRLHRDSEDLRLKPKYNELSLLIGAR